MYRTGLKDHENRMSVKSGPKRLRNYKSADQGRIGKP
jgi:hypothetical protein